MSWKSNKENNKRKVMENQDLAYVAGFFDGEGSVRVAKSERRGKYQRKNPSYTLQCYVVNTDLVTLTWLHECFGGAIYMRHVKSGYKPCGQWCVSSNDALRFLLQITPFLKQKRREAEIAITFQQYNTQFAKGYKRTRLPEELTVMDEVSKILMAAKKENKKWL